MSDAEAKRTRKRRGMGYVSGHPIEAKSTRELFGAPHGLPRSASLLHLIGGIDDQGRTETCVGQAFGSVIDMHMVAKGLVRPRASRLGIYTLARSYSRKTEDEALKDQGSSPAMALYALSEIGIPREDKWPFDLARLNDPLPMDVLDQGEGFKLEDYAKLDTSSSIVDDARNAIAHGQPVLCGTQVDESFIDADASSEPIGAPKGKTIGGHYVTLVAYDDDGFIILNSWGIDWGQRGIARVTNEFVEASMDPIIIKAVPVWPATKEKAAS